MTEPLNKWLEGKGVKLYIANDKSYVDKSISRRLLK